MLELFVFTSRGSVIAEIIAKRQCPSFFGAASLDDVNVVTVRPLGRPMEEWTERVVRMGYVNVSDGLNPFAVRRSWLKRRDGHLYVDNWFGAEAWNRSRAVMVDAQGQRSKRSAKAARLGFERSWPIRIVGQTSSFFSCTGILACLAVCPERIFEPCTRVNSHILSHGPAGVVASSRVV